MSPDIYLRSKVPVDMYETLIKFAEIRKLNRANLVNNFDLFPSHNNLLVFERKYGDSISYEDQFGIKKRKKKRKQNKEALDDTVVSGSQNNESVSLS